MGLGVVFMTNVDIRLPKNRTFLVVGSGDPIKTFLQNLKLVFPESLVYVLSDKVCDESWSMCEKKPIEDVASDLGFKVDFIANINSNDVLEGVRKFGCNICFVLGSRWILKKPIIEYFNGNIFNYHTSDLPSYKGGGGYRWQVMNGEKYIYIAFHQVTEVIDNGPILKVYSKELSGDDCYPRDIFEGLYEFTKCVFFDFLEHLKLDVHEMKVQPKEGGAYFPLLDNEKNGAIDLSWGRDDIKAFVNAFSFPYKGAFIFYNDKKYFIKDVGVSNVIPKYHPFLVGLIINVTERYLEFVAKDGVVKVKDIADENGSSIEFKSFKLGDRFYMPSDKLLEAKLYRPSNKKFILKVN